MMAYAPMNDAYLESVRDRLAGVTRGRVVMSEPMSKHTSWKVGGPTDFWIEPVDEEDFVNTVAALNEQKVRWVVLGKGSNTLVGDEGFRGAVINLEEGFVGIDHKEDGEGGGGYLLYAVGGVAINALLRHTIVHRLQGLEMLTGIPGTVGGTVRMNGGTHLGELKDALHDVRLYRTDGSLEWVEGHTLGLRYRDSDLKPGEVVLAARFRVRTAENDDFALTIREVKERRRASQPLSSPTGGSTFTNPDADKAWRLIDAAGLRGYREGGARFSEIHPNFIVNDGTATATDIEKLIQHAKQEVLVKCGVSLREEICRVGVNTKNTLEGEE